MQNRYVGDVADFAKHGLLRFLSGKTSTDELPRLRLGLVWYLHHDQRHGPDSKKLNYDGKHTGYLVRTPDDDREEYRECDSALWETLRDLVLRDARCVHCAEESGVLPQDTEYFTAQLQYTPRTPLPTKRVLREHWFQAALAATAESKLVCVDPDNGIAPDEKMYRKDGPKFTYMSDLRAFWERDQSLVAYHHIGRNGGTAKEQIKKLTSWLKSELAGSDPIPLLFRRGSARVFLVLAHPGHEKAITERVGSLIAGPWGRHFERVRI